MASKIQSSPEKIGPFQATNRTGKAGEKTPQYPITVGLPMLFAIVEEKTGHDFSSYKKTTVLRRIDRRMVEHRATDFSHYLAVLEQDPHEAQALCRELLIGVTRFFRDAETFDFLGREIIPQLFVSRSAGEPIRIWHACCATGEEVYSVAILIREYLEKEQLRAKVQIFATDLDEEAVVQAKAGLYPDDIAADVGEARLRRFFTGTEGGWKVTKELREMIVFAHHSIIKDPPFARLDLLVCRNFLIYLDQEMQKRLVPLFHQVLNPGGYLFLGSAETVGLHSDLFVPVDQQWKIFARLDGPRKVEALFPYSGSIRKVISLGDSGRPAETEKPASVAVAEKLLMERYLPARVIVNEKNELVYSSTGASKYLQWPEGEPTRNLLRMAKNELRSMLRTAIYKAFTDQQESTFKRIRLVADGQEMSVNLVVIPYKAPPAGNLALVIFEPVQPAPDLPVSGEEDLRGDPVYGPIIRQLKEKLRDTSEQLQATSEQLETSNHGCQSANEELMSTNEELQSANEELQATNEELETSKEELQSLNEELVTVNAELQEKMEELSQSNSDLENLFASSQIATIFLDRSLIIKRFSPAMAAIFNLIPADIGRPFRFLNGTIHWSDLAGDAAAVLQHLVPVEREVAALTDGRTFIMRVLPYRTSGGVIDGIVVTLNDITLRKQTERALQESEQRLELFIDQAPASLAMFDTEMRYLSVSRRWLKDYGLDGRNLLGLSHYEVFPEIPGAWREAHRRGLAGEVLRAESDRFLRADGSVQWIRWEIRPWTDAAGRICGIVIFTEDITDLKKSEEILGRYELLASHSRDIILFLRLDDGRIVEANGAALRAYGYSHDELLGLTIKDLRAPETIGQTEGQMAEAFSRGILFETMHRRKDGTTFPVEVSSQGAVIDDTRMLMGMIRDISERKRAEEDRKSLWSQLVQAQKMEAIGTLAGGIAHDFNNILGAILGYAEMAREDSSKGSRAARDLDQVIAAGTRAKELVRQILTFSRQTDTERIPLQPATIIKEALKLLRSSLPATIAIEHDIAADSGSILADPTHIHQIVMNLCTNAYQAMEETGGKLSLFLRRKVLLPQDLESDAAVQPGDFIELTVKDNGPGIDPGIQGRIFDPYFTTKATGQGTGMGLAIVHGIVKSYGGLITCRSKLGLGTVFTISLPAVKAPTEAARPPVESVPGGTEHILFVDDEQLLANMSRIMLERLGYTVTTRTSSLDALATFRSRPDDFDLVITDQTMPKMTGYELARNMLLLRPKLPVILCTGYSSTISEDKINALGIKGFAFKPLAKQDIAALIRKVLDGAKNDSP